MQGVLSGILRATGRQMYAAVANFISYYVVGLPLGISLALVVGLKAKGMWIGLSVAVSMQVLWPGPIHTCTILLEQ
jgi:MATE family multidrug resistance protein